MPIKTHVALFSFFLMWLLSWQNVNAAVIDDLYDAKIAVYDQSEQTQNNAFSLALKQVFVKVRGNNDLLSNQKIISAVKRPTRFIRSYSYDKQGSQLYLIINFEPQRVVNVIRSSGFPVWDKRRPDSLIWLAIKPSDDSVRQIATPSEFVEIYQQLRLRAAQRGIRLLFPLWDLSDVQNLGVYDIWGGFSTQISQASERYAVPSILSARIYLSENQSSNAPENRLTENANLDGKWTSDWTIVEGSSLLAGQVQGDNPLAIAENLIDDLADQLSLKYSIDLAQIDRADTKVKIVVNNIDSLTYFSLALRFLENMSIVDGATLIKQQGSRATFELDLLGDIDDLTNALSLDNKIRPVVDDFGQPIVGLEFFWVK